MSRFKMVMKKCAVCGHEAEYKLIMSTSGFGSMDLDTRPPALARFLLSDQVEFCEHCGYANIDISCLSRENVQEYMETDEYQNILNSSINETSKKYLLTAYLTPFRKHTDYRGGYYLKAAWAFDDHHDTENAIEARKKSVDFLMQYAKIRKKIKIEVIVVDVLRRSLQFEEAKKLALDLLERVDDDLMKKILLFQIELINKKDVACHKVSEI